MACATSPVTVFAALADAVLVRVAVLVGDAPLLAYRLLVLAEARLLGAGLALAAAGGVARAVVLCVLNNSRKTNDL